MLTTKHFRERMSQRGVTKRMVDLVLEYGRSQGDKIILNKKVAQSVLDEIDRIKKDLLKIKDKGGLTVVYSDESLITTYKA